MVEQVEFTNMCMICNGSKVVVIDRKKKDWPGRTCRTRRSGGAHLAPVKSGFGVAGREPPDTVQLLENLQAFVN